MDDVHKEHALITTVLEDISAAIWQMDERLERVEKRLDDGQGLQLEVADIILELWPRDDYFHDVILPRFVYLFGLMEKYGPDQTKWPQSVRRPVPGGGIMDAHEYPELPTARDILRDRLRGRGPQQKKQIKGGINVGSKHP